MPKNSWDEDYLFSDDKDSDKKPITQFFAFLDNTATLMRGVVTRYIQVSDNAWRAFLGMLFIIFLWASGDYDKIVFSIMVAFLGILILIDIAIDNWGKIFRAFRHEKTFSEINTQSPTLIIQVLMRYNIVSQDMIELLKFMKKKNWINARMVDVLFAQQHLDDFAVNEFLTANLSKKDTMRILWNYHNAANDETLKQVLQKWGYADDIMKVCLKRQISSIELIRLEKSISRSNYKTIEQICPFKNVNKHWLLKPFRLIFVLAGVVTAYIMFVFQQNESLKAISSGAVEATTQPLTSLLAFNLLVAISSSLMIWAVVYAVTFPIMKFAYNRWKDFEFNQAFDLAFSKL
ncbi:MAG: hypothetical protein ABIH20_00495 [Candidatus Diapherotrites archaeon]